MRSIGTAKQLSRLGIRHRSPRHRRGARSRTLGRPAARSRPCPMGWRSRDWYLGEYAPLLFDRNGNIGPSV
ncbi:hypothetical protein [Nocardia paucivorans]|uniref:hypothetical protein n=1 Tax=Nocardia paucivorans TaxID=114259 RepID=UPI0002E577BE|nr:hypothetical protein [Nocardia paucivorans]